MVFSNFPTQRVIILTIGEGLDLLPVFRRLYQVNLEQQKQIVSQYHQLEDGFIGPE